MRKIIIYIIAITAIFNTLFSSCENRVEDNNATAHSVVVIHSWDSIGEEKNVFPEHMRKEFKRLGVNADIHHIYTNMIHRSHNFFFIKEWNAYMDSIRKWKPEVILINDDPVMEWILTQCTNDSIFKNTPAVFAGVNALIRDSLHNFPLMTGFEDRIDLNRNLEVFMRLTGMHAVNMELDYTPYDERLRSSINEFLSDTTRFINNADSHLRDTRENVLRQEVPGKVVVNIISCANPYTNIASTQDSTGWKDHMKNIYQNASKTFHMQVKYDIFSNNIIDRSHQPQFTCIREQFNDPTRIRFLCGYFTSVQTQVEDQVQYASRILAGDAPKYLPISIHNSGYHMDWNAMQMMSPKLSYQAYAHTFHIVNAPFYLESPLLFGLAIVMIIVVIALIVHGIVASMNKWKQKEQKILLEQLNHEDKVHSLIFSNTMDTLWDYKDGVFSFGAVFAEKFNLGSNKMTTEQLMTHVHKDSMQSFEVLTHFREQRGKKVVRMKLTPNEGKDWFWTEATYTATDETARSGELYGLLLNIDEQKATEDKLEQAQILASQVALKENFLANISHDLRTPLGAVTGFSTLLSTPGMIFEEGEREQYREIIHQNTQMILDMIDSVMEKAQIETGDLEILPKPMSIMTLINDSYNTNKIIAPSHLQFLLETDTPDCMLNIDATRTKQVINNFLSNAFKFTTIGSVTLGWKNIPNTDMVEVYVQDTGIGVEKDKQDQLFERYVKVNETDRGTGLGLNISKTIMEKQGGTIGLESEFGNGSKFFFRLKKYVQCMLLAIVMGFGMVMQSSCTTEMRRPKNDANILVVHGYGKTNQAYRGFNEDILSTLISNGINPVLRHIYLNLDDPRTEQSSTLAEEMNELVDNGWKADVVLTEGDRTAHVLLTNADKGRIKDFQDYPVVLGSLHHPEWGMIRKFKNVVAIHDPIDYCSNINLACEMTGTNVVAIELDYFHQDSLIRDELRKAIARPPYVDNTDFHSHFVSDSTESKALADSIIVMSFSTERPEMNSPLHMTNEQAYWYLGMVYAHSYLYPCLSVKKDMYSSSIVDKTERPQFTAVKAGFADGEARYLCGYFASYHTVATDLAELAVKILQGADPYSLVGYVHQKKYYMDYQAMKVLGMDYKDYCDRFEIVGAPIESTMPVLYYGSWAAIALVFLGALISIFLVVQSWNNRNAQRILDDVKRRYNLRELAMHGADSRNVRSTENIKDIISHIHPDYSSEIPLMMQATDIAGTHSYDVYVDIDENGSYHWWQLRFAVQFDQNGDKRADGILINIDGLMQHKEELRLAMQLAEEARQKEDFLTTISHEIRTPLNAVVGFSDLMVSMPEGTITESELMDYSKYIKTNNNTLTTMIEDILMFSRIESGRIKYISEEFDVSELLSEIEAEWKDLIPNGVELKMTNFVRFTYANADRARVKYIITQFLSNAIKFTKFGIILLGVAFRFNHDDVEFFVIDTGCGIPREKQPLTFNLFWKDNEFIPGLGLGLNVAQKLAEGMDLQLDVESKVGVGSKFSLFVPAYSKRPQMPPQGMMGMPPMGEGGMPPQGMMGMPPIGEGGMQNPCG